MYSSSTTFTATGESDLFTVPGNYVAYLKRLAVSNRSAALAVVNVIYYNGTAKKTVLTLTVAVNETVVLKEDELPTEACPTKIAINTTQAPVDISYSVELT